MNAPDRHAALIASLGHGLSPVRRLASPGRRTLGWLAVVGALAVLLCLHYGMDGMRTRWSHTPDLAWSALGALATAAGAAWAAFAAGVPGRSRIWSALPLPGLALWLSASGWGCLRTWVAPATQLATMHESGHCLGFILALSVPLSALLVWLLRRACPLRPVRTAVLIGLASASASAALLQIGHEFDASMTDLAAHALAVGLVIGINVAMGGRLLERRAPARKRDFDPRA